jgi:4a-hydroxytetrahydrobiopterin dehydratase
MSGLADKSCVPCRGGMAPLTEAQIVPLLAQLDGWEVEDGHHLQKVYSFRDFATALAFVNRVGAVADQEDHHPDIALSWGEVQVVVFTHKIDGLTESDFVFAAKTDRQYHPEPVARRQVWRAEDPAHAHLLAGLLESRGIDAQVRGENLFSGEGGLLPTEAGPTVWVPVDDFDRAHEILTTHHDSDEETPDDQGDAA